MPSSVRTRIVRIGNSQGVRIPKHLLQQTALGSEVELELEGDHIVIRPAVHPRQSWDDSFREMAARGDDFLLDGDIPSLTEWDEEEWEW